MPTRLFAAPRHLAGQGTWQSHAGNSLAPVFFPKNKCFVCLDLFVFQKINHRNPAISIGEDFLKFQPSDSSIKLNEIYNHLIINIQQIRNSDLRRSYPISYPNLLNQYTVVLMKNDRTQILHRIILPCTWQVLVLLSWHWPGDKGLSFYFASIVGAWVHELVRLTGGAFLIGQCVGGLPIMFGVGWLLDRQRVGPTIYAVFAPFVVWAVWIGFRYLPDALMILVWGLYAVGVAGLIVFAVNTLKGRLLHNKTLHRTEYRR